jgi:hypothetical protein
MCSLLHSPLTSSLIGLNILLSNQLWKTLSLHSSLNVSDKFSHPYNTTGKIIAIYIQKVTLEAKNLHKLFCLKAKTFKEKTLT